mgnify:CR=1 FL=1
MKKILKKHWLLILILSIPYFFVVLSGCIKVNFDMTAPGSLNQVGNVINVNDENEEEIVDNLPAENAKGYQKVLNWLDLM